MKLYVFNPDTDMALANNEENYMAPASACRMAQDLALLPVWYAQPGSAVLAPSAYNADYLQKMKQLFPLSVQLVTEPELPDYAESQIVPWGWNRAFRKRMHKAGIAQHKLPTEAELRECRMLSSRAYGMRSGCLRVITASTKASNNKEVPSDLGRSPRINSPLFSLAVSGAQLVPAKGKESNTLFSQSLIICKNSGAGGTLSKKYLPFSGSTVPRLPMICSSKP